METRKCAICKKDLPADTKHFGMRYDRKQPMFQSSCKVCHSEYRKEHYLRNKQKYVKKAIAYKQRTYKWFEELKSKLKCEDCGEDRYWVLDFHHIDPKTKDADISSILHKGSKQKLLTEMKKCKVLCSNCHRDLHFKEKQAGDA